MVIQKNIALAPLTTLNVGGPARFFAEAHSEHDVQQAVAYAAARHLPLFVLGGGSNLVIADEGWPGLVLKVALRGVEFEGDREKMLFYAGAGEDWDSLVALAVGFVYRIATDILRASEVDQNPLVAKAKVLAIASLGAWVALIAAGRYLAYTHKWEMLGVPAIL